LNEYRGDIVPNKVVPNIQPVHEVYDKVATIVTSNSAINATSANVYNTPADKDFYLTGAYLSVIKDVTSTSTFSSLLVAVNGSTPAVLVIRGLTLTVQSGSLALTFNPPIKLDRSSAVTVTNTTATGNVSATAGIIGYLKSNRSNVGS